jgi:hypothetical protein
MWQLCASYVVGQLVVADMQPNTRAAHTLQADSAGVM